MTRQRGDGGSISLELTILAPAILLVFAFIVVAGRVTNVRSNVQEAARVGARTASQARVVSEAAAEALTGANSTLADADISCTDLKVTMTGQLEQGELITVRVECSAPTGELAGVGLPGSYQVAAEFSEVVDRYRGIR